MTSQWRHRNKTHSCYSELNYVQTYISDFFYILKVNRIMPFCNLFMGRPSYFRVVVAIWYVCSCEVFAHYLVCIEKSGLYSSVCLMCHVCYITVFTASCDLILSEELNRLKLLRSSRFTNTLQKCLPRCRVHLQTLSCHRKLDTCLCVCKFLSVHL